VLLLQSQLFAFQELCASSLTPFISATGAETVPHQFFIFKRRAKDKMATNTLVDGRLPSIAVPKHYDLCYKKIDLEKHMFDGTVSIQLEVPEGAATWPRFSLVLHALDLNIVSAKLQSLTDDKTWEAEEVRYVKRDQTCELVFGPESQWVEGQSYMLTIDFIGVLNDLMRGLYRSTYVGLDGATHTMATTQFEATDARRAFPCLDEPALKATFTLTVTIPSSLECISNTPPASVHTTFDKGTSTKTITFQTTPRMSTYLLALVVGQFDGISKTSGHIQTTVYTVPGKAHQGEFCLDTAVKCLDLFQEMFGVPYPLGKSDLLAIPDFAAGAMEVRVMCCYCCCCFCIGSSSLLPLLLYAVHL